MPRPAGGNPYQTYRRYRTFLVAALSATGYSRHVLHVSMLHYSVPGTVLKCANTTVFSTVVVVVLAHDASALQPDGGRSKISYSEYDIIILTVSIVVLMN